MRKMKKVKYGIILAGAAVLSAAVLSACSAKAAASADHTAKETTSADGTATETVSGEKKTIRYGKSQGPYTELFEAAVVPILEQEGYTVEGTDFSDLLTADVALNDGDVDVNVEQHTAYLENFNSSYNGDLTPISPIPTVPAGIYSSTHTSLDEIKKGAKIAVPNDASNTARAYALLQKAGWIRLNDQTELSKVTQDDITENPYGIEFTEMNSLTIPNAMEDFDYVVITGSIVYNAGIDPSSALLNEDILEPLILQVVVKKENAQADWAKAIGDAYHSDAFKEYMKEHNDGLWYVPEELQ